MSKFKSIARFGDSVINKITGLGTSDDAGAYNGAAPVQINYHEVINIYRGYWLARKMINIPIQDMLKNGRTITNLDDDDQKLYAEAWKKTGAHKAVRSALRWASLVGGAGIIPVSEKLRLDAPFTPNDFRADGLVRFVVLDAYELTTLDDATIISDITSPHFRMPESFSYGGQDISIENVIPVHGAEVPNQHYTDAMNVRKFWGMSKMYYYKEPVLNAHAMFSAVNSMMASNNVDVMKVPGLYDGIAACGSPTEQAEMNSAMQARGALFARFKSMFNLAMIDNEETMERIKYDFSGIPQLLGEAVTACAGASDIPMTRLAGISPGGLNATGQSDLENYYNNIAATANEDLTPIYDAIDRYMTLSVFGEERELEYKINSPHVMSEMQQAELDAKNVETVTKVDALSIVPDFVVLKKLQSLNCLDIDDDMVDMLEEEFKENGFDQPDPLGDPLDDPEDDPLDDEDDEGNDDEPEED